MLTFSTSDDRLKLNEQIFEEEHEHYFLWGPIFTANSLGHPLRARQNGTGDQKHTPVGHQRH